MTPTPDISPRARRLADANGLNLDAIVIPGSGPNGRIMEADVQAFLDAARQTDNPLSVSSPAAVAVTPNPARLSASFVADDASDLSLGLPGSRVRLGSTVSVAPRPTVPLTSPPSSPAIRVLALDLERTLISDAMNAEPRPGLYNFLQFCLAAFPRVVLFTSVNADTARRVLAQLAQEGAVPPEFLDNLEVIYWEGKYKNLDWVPNAAVGEILLLDDDPGWIALGQEAQYIGIVEYDPYLVRGEDREFSRIRRLLEMRLRLQSLAP